MSEILRISSVVWCLIHVLVSFLIFYVPRYSWKKSLVLILAFLGPLCALNVELFLEMGKTVYSQSLALVLMLPIFILFFVLSKHRDFRFVFTFCVVNTIFAELIILSILIDELLTPRTHIALFLVRLLSFPIIECLAIRKIRTAYFELQSAMKKGWGIFALMSFLFYVMLLVFAGYPNLIIDRPEDIPAMMLLLLLMPLMYLTILRVLFHQNKIHLMEREEEVLRVQTANLENRIRQNAEREELIQIARHDLRHQLTTIGSMLEQGEYEQAKEYISTAVEPLQAVSVEHYCANPILDIVFNSYFSRAKAKGICIEASLAVPKRLQVDDNELSVVLANALENAIHACAKLPEGRRVIRCRCVARPQLMFQISNPFDGEVEFDKQGRPVSKEPGHGIGTRSIHSFCERNNGFADYKVKDGWFYLRIVLPE